MPQTQTGKILRIHFSEHDQYAGKPLYPAIVDKCRELKIAGATVFRGLEGYGETAEILPESKCSAESSLRVPA